MVFENMTVGNRTYMMFVDNTFASWTRKLHDVGNDKEQTEESRMSKTYQKSDNRSGSRKKGFTCRLMANSR